MKPALSIIVVVMICGCGVEPDRGVLPSPAAVGSNKWTNLSGVYTAQRIQMGYMVNHTAFVDEVQLRPGAQIEIQQDSEKRLTVIYETSDGNRKTNEINVEAVNAHWRWLDGDLVWSISRAGNNFRLPIPGRGKLEWMCVVRKQQDGTIMVKSTHKAGGTAFWLISWQNPCDESEIRLVQDKTPSQTADGTTPKPAIPRR